MYFFKYWLLYNFTPYDLFFCGIGVEYLDWLVSDGDAAGLVSYAFLYTTDIPIF